MTTTAPSTTPSKSGVRRANALPSGCMLDEYRIDSILGAGGFGVTYKAMDTHLDTWVAVKEYFPVEWSFRSPDGVTVHPNTQGDATAAKGEVSDYIWGLERFLDEARVLARIQHPYVVGVKRYFRAHGTAYIVMAFEEGEPLSAILQDGETLGEDQVRGLLEDVLPALRAVHEQGYLHRDIKPANLYVRASDHRVLLIDFGAAREAVGRHSKSVTSLVTPGYSPPEQYTTRNDRYGTWTDVYALGAVLYRCVVGHTPIEAAERLLEDSLEPASKICAGRYSTNLLRVIDQALAVRPEQRFRTVADMQEALCGSPDEDSDETVIMAPLLAKSAKAHYGVETARLTGSPTQRAVEPEQAGRDWMDASQTAIGPTTRHRLNVLQGPSKSAHLSWRRFWMALIGSGLALAAVAASLVWLWPSASRPGGQPPPNPISQQDAPVKTPIAPPVLPAPVTPPLQTTAPVAATPPVEPPAAPPPPDVPATPPGSTETASPAPVAPPLAQGSKPPETETAAPSVAAEPVVPPPVQSQPSAAIAPSEPTGAVAEGVESSPSVQTPAVSRPAEPLDGSEPEPPAAATILPPAAVPPGPATATPRTPAVSSPPPTVGLQPSPATRQRSSKPPTSARSQERDGAAKNSQSAKSSSRYARQRSDRRRRNTTPAVTTAPATPARAARPAAPASNRIEPWDKPTDSGFNQK